MRDAGAGRARQGGAGPSTSPGNRGAANHLIVRAVPGIPTRITMVVPRRRLVSVASIASERGTRDPIVIALGMALREVAQRRAEAMQTARNEGAVADEPMEPGPNAPADADEGFRVSPCRSV